MQATRILLSIFLSALLLVGLLLWWKKYLTKEKNSANSARLSEIFSILLVCLIFAGTQILIEHFLSSHPTSTSQPIYFDAEQQFNIGKSFYMGDGLPKDNSQALYWLLLAAKQGHTEANELVQVLGYEIEQQQTTQQSTENYQEETPTFAVDIIPAYKLNANLDAIAGMSEAKIEAKKMLDFIKNPHKFQKIGAKAPKGILLYGPPGTGKTLLARAIASEAKVTFISVAGSAFEEAYVGKGAARVRELFELARKMKPAIIFIDEIDAMAPARGKAELSQSHIQTVNQLLAEMENVDEQKNSEIFVLAATNRIESLDQAILRPGRFDWQIHIRLPSDKDRKEILQKLITKLTVDNTVNIDSIVERSAGFSGADLTNLLNEAALFAVENNKKAIDNETIELAFAKLATYQKDLSPEFTVRILSPSEIKTKLADVAGMNEAKQEITEVIEFLKNPAKFERLGAKAPGGVLIYGPPGTGKTMMARAIAGEANAAFIAVSGSDFDERYVGVGASRVRELFKVARRYQPCVVFIDEIDALAPMRSGSDNTGRDQTINQFLSEMDNIQNQKNEGIIFIAATNRIDILDPAVLRPGRFDRKVFFRLPSLEERADILKAHLKKIKIASNIDVNTLAKITVGYSGADLANLVNEAAIDATRKNKAKVDMASFEEANDKISLGVNQGSGSYSEEEKRRTAYHEAGHALVGLLHPDHPRILHKMTIGLRGGALGVTHFKIQSDEYSYTKKEFESMIATALGGYIAEELIYGKENISAGASSDLINANRVAKEMVSRLGMADDQSLIVTEIFPEAGELNNANTILKRDYNAAKNILQKNMDKLHILAKALIEKETLDYDQIVKLLNLPPDQKLKN